MEFGVHPGWYNCVYSKYSVFLYKKTWDFLILIGNVLVYILSRYMYNNFDADFNMIPNIIPISVLVNKVMYS